MNNWNNGRLLEKIKFSKVYFIEKKRNTNLEARIELNVDSSQREDIISLRANFE